MFNTTLMIETAIFILAAYLGGCVFGYGLRRILHAGRGTHSPQVVAPVAQVPAPVVSPTESIRRPVSPAARLAARADEPIDIPRSRGPRPPALDKPHSGRADDLKLIKGIGPKIETALNALGVYHFDQIATWTRAECEWVDAHLGFKGRVGRERWVDQATRLLKAAA